MNDVRLNGTGPLAPRPGGGTRNLQETPAAAPAPDTASAVKQATTGPLDANALSGPAGTQSEYGLKEFNQLAQQAAEVAPKVFKLVKALETPAPQGNPTLDVRPGTIDTVQAQNVQVQATPSQPSVPTGLGLAMVELPTASPVAPQQAPAPVKKKKRRRRGFFRRIGSALKKAVKKVGGAIAKGIQKVGRFVAKYNPVTLSLKATAAIAGAVGLDGVAKAINKVNDFVVKVGTEIADGVAAVAKAALTLDTKDLKDWWKKNGSYVLMVASVVAAVVPGMQVVAIGLAAYQAYQGGKMMVDGIKTGDWKKAALGLVSVAGAVAGGVTAIGAKALGSTATAIANTASKVADYTQKAVKAFDAIKTGDYGSLVTMAAGAAASGLEFLGEGAQKFADKAKEWADKANTYYQNGKAAYDAFKSGDITAGLASLTNLGVSAAGDAKVDPQTLKTLETASRYASHADGLAKAIKTGDIDGALNLVNSIAQKEGLTKGNLIDPDKVKLAGQLEDLTKAITQKDFSAAASVIGSLASDHGIVIPINDDLKEKLEQAKTYGAIVVDFAKAVDSGNYQGALAAMGKFNDAAKLGISIPIDPELKAQFEKYAAYAPLVSDLTKQINAGNFQGTLAAIDKFNAEAKKSGRTLDEGLTRDLAKLADAIKNENQGGIQTGLQAVLQRTVGTKAEQPTIAMRDVPGPTVA